jgi:hypothetical protein
MKLKQLARTSSFIAAAFLLRSSGFTLPGENVLISIPDLTVWKAFCRRSLEELRTGGAFRPARV